MNIIITLVFLALAIYFYKVAVAFHKRIEELEMRERIRRNNEIAKNAISARDYIFGQGKRKTTKKLMKDVQKRGADFARRVEIGVPCHCGKVCVDKRALAIHQARMHKG